MNVDILGKLAYKKEVNMKTYRRRSCVLILNNKCEEFKTLSKEIDKYNSVCREVFRHTINLMKTNQIYKNIYGSFCDICIVKDSVLYNQLKDHIVEKEDNKNGITWPTITVGQYTNYLKNTVFNDFAQKGIANYLRGIVKHVLDRIKGKWKRDEKKTSIASRKIPHVSFNSHVIHMREGMKYNEIEQTVDVPTSSGKINIPIFQMFSKGRLDKNFGGNLEFKYKKKNYKNSPYAIVIKASVDIVEDAAYEPDGFIGFDINQKQENWIHFSDGEVVSRPKSMTEKIQEIKTLNYRISNKKKQAIIKFSETEERVVRTKERRKYRLKQTDVLAALQKETKIFAEYIINKAVSQNKGIGIDKISPGASGNGEFGQYIASYVQEICENRRIPFYICPSPYTSRRCPCGNQDAKNRKGDKFKCVECGYESHADHNAAKNIKRIAEELHSKNVMYCGLEAGSVDFLIKSIDALVDILDKKGLLYEESLDERL